MGEEDPRQAPLLRPVGAPDGALNKYLAEKDALHAGRKPREDVDGYTVKMLRNDFLNAKQRLVESGELTRRSRQNYKETCELVLLKFGKPRLVADLAPDDFGDLRKAMVEKGWGAVTLRNVVQCVRVVFKFAFDNGSIDRPVRYGQIFKTPSRKTVHIDRAKKGPRMLQADEILALIDGALVIGETGPELVQAGRAMRAMVLVGINCGFGSADCGALPLTAPDPADGWVNYPRPKTGITRRGALWPETVAALTSTGADCRGAARGEVSWGLLRLPWPSPTDGPP